MSAEFDQVRASAIQIAHVDLAKVVRETRLQNHGPIVDGTTCFIDRNC